MLQRTAALIGNKCRCSKAKVASATDLEGNSVEATEFQSLHDASFIYRLGETVEEPEYDGDIRVECTTGIHFFKTFEEARDY